MNNNLLLGDCADHMRNLAPNSVDAIVTDPPYALVGSSGTGGFMGAKWDSELPTVEMWREALRVAKPGAHLLAFGGTRTYHRLACAIEDAGWEIRDCIMWVYGSGFPKGMDIAKHIDKTDGIWRGRAAKVQSRNFAMSGPNYERTDKGVAVTEDAKRWEGWNTQLKPAVEPIVVARKPLEGTVVANVLKYGTGAINIDGCRVPTEENIFTQGNRYSAKVYGKYNGMEPRQSLGQQLGRFPANLVHDGSPEVLALFPDSDSGSAARFFYCAKASRKERGEGNVHPTVKPIALMRWLIRLVTRKGGVVLDPFMGSGTTGVAAIQEGMDFIGIERDPHYHEIATNRIAADVPHQPDLFDSIGGE